MSDGLAVTLAESRFDRQERITWWDQDRLARARVLVVGAGALGNEVVKNLVLVGVGSVVVVDFDTIETSNLSRCVFFRPEDEGRSKAETLAERASEISPATTVVGVDGDVRALGTGVALRADVMVGALDSRESRLFVNRLAWRARRAWVDGAIEALSGLARVFSPPDSCYECTLSAADFEILSHRQSCRLLSREDLLEGKVPTTASTSSIVGGLEVQEVVKLIHADQAGVNPVDGAYVVDGANNDTYVVRYPFNEECLAHQVYEAPIVLAGTPDTTFADVVAAAGWEEALVELGDDHLVAWTCTICEETVPAAGAISLLTVRDAICPTCDEPRQPVSTAAVHVPGNQAPTALDAFGVRSDEVLAVRQGAEYRHVWVQPPAGQVLGGWS